MQKRQSRVVASFDNPKEMAQYQLELAWLGSIFTSTDRCRKFGLCGLDRGMFDDPEIFDIGLEMLRDMEAKDYEPSDATLKRMMKNLLTSKLIAMENEMQFLPAYYQVYAREIESRSEETEAPWLK